MTESLSAAVDATAAGRAACEIGWEYGFRQLANVGLLCSVRVCACVRVCVCVCARVVCVCTCVCVCMVCCVGLCLTILVGFIS